MALSAQTCRKAKALMIIAMLCVAEGQRVSLANRPVPQMPTNKAGTSQNLRPRVHAGAGPDVSSRREMLGPFLASVAAASIAMGPAGPAYAESGPWSTKQFLDKLEA